MTICATPPTIPPAQDLDADGGDNEFFLELLDDVLIQLEEMRKVCAPDVADMSVDIETAHKFTLFALNSPSPDAFIKALVKAEKLLPREEETYADEADGNPLDEPTLIERVQKALAILLGE